MDRIIPRMSRALAEAWGWSAGAEIRDDVDALFLSGYWEARQVELPEIPVAAYFSHREDPNARKSALYDEVAGRVALRVATARMYAAPLEKYGPTVQVPAPVETKRFVLAPAEPRPKPVAGFSGWVYTSGRKGQTLAGSLVSSPIGKFCDWRASGHGWPVPTRLYSWDEMPSFYQGLDIFVCTSSIEGIPMPPLEALACGASVVIPRGVGMLDEIPDTVGIHRYRAGDPGDLQRAFQEAVWTRAMVDREALRASIKGNSVHGWCVGIANGMAQLLGDRPDGGVADSDAAAVLIEAPRAASPRPRETGSTRGIYCVAYDIEARACAHDMMESAKTHMPDIPICLCSDGPIGPEDVFVEQPDADVGGRIAKLRVYELAPAEWDTVLYLDADTEIIAPVYQLFEWVEDGWDLVICKDAPASPTLTAFWQTGGGLGTETRSAEIVETVKVTGTDEVLQLNGGVFAFKRGLALEAFFTRWLQEWLKYGRRDQAALLRALYADPLRVLYLGNEWNIFPNHNMNQEKAGILHWPGKARRWGRGRISFRLDSEEAWEQVAGRRKR